MTYQLGQVLPWGRPRDIVAGPEIRPTWFGMTVPPQKERAVREFLRRKGIYAFYPSEERKRFIRGKKHITEVPFVSGCVYAQFTQSPQWDVLKFKRRLITGVYARQGQPITIPRDIIRHMQGLTVEAEKLRKARLEMLRVRPGDKAKIVSGPLEGFLVDVDSVANGQAWFKFMTGAKGSADLGTLERVTQHVAKTHKIG